jgi:hypothetical protein
MVLWKRTTLIVAVISACLATSERTLAAELEEDAVNRKPKSREEAAALLGKRIIFENNGDASSVSLRGKDATPEMFVAIEAFPELSGLGVLDADVDGATVVPTLQQLPNLTYVRFIRCSQIADDVVPVVAAIPRLRDASFEGCPITDHGLPAILASQSLVALWMSETAITDTGIAALAKLPTLGRLAVTDTAVTDAGLEALRGHDRLAVVWASGTKIGDDGMQHLATCPLLEEVLARRTHLTDAGIEAIAKAKKLKLLYASGRFSQRSLTALSACTDLHTFLLEGEIDLGDEDVEMVASFKRCRSVTLLGSRITDAGTARIKELLPNTRIDIGPPE